MLFLISISRFLIFIRRSSWVVFEVLGLSFTLHSCYTKWPRRSHSLVQLCPQRHHLLPHGSPSSIAMRSPSNATIADLVTEAGAGTDLVAYLEDRGIKTPATLALLAQDDADFDTVVLQPLMSGWKTKSGGAITIAESEKPIARAILKHMWNLAKGAWKAQMAASTPIPASAASATGGTSTSGSSTKDDKVPKTLPAGHELTVTKMFTPVGLGEILQKRTFQASGEPNVLAKKEPKPTTFTVSDDKLVATEEQPWQPRGLLAILDGLASIRWAYVLLSVGPEQSVHSFFDWATKLARSRPNKPDQLNQWWTTISWRLSLELRAGRSWDEATGPIQRDYDTFTECMGRDPIQIVKPPKTGGKSNQEAPFGKAKGKHKSPRPQPYYARGHKGGYQDQRYQKSYPESPFLVNLVATKFT